MTIHFRSGQILFSGGAVAMSSACCCAAPCPCTTPNPQPSPCTECAVNDYDTTFTTPRDWQIDISGVVAGSATCSLNCSAVASHVAFFNRSFTFSPCATTVTYSECIWKCSYADSFAGGDQHVVEYNYMRVQPVHRGTPGWVAQVTMASYIAEVLAATGTDPTTICSRVSGNEQLLTGVSGIDSQTVFQQNFSLADLTFQQYPFDTSDCDPATCDNTPGSVPGKCYPAGTSLTGATPSTSATFCMEANDVTGATVSVYAV